MTRTTGSDHPVPTQIGNHGWVPSLGLGKEGATNSSSRGIRKGEFSHVCASQNALFAECEEGVFYPYHFNAKTSVTLVATGESEEKRT